MQRWPVLFNCKQRERGTQQKKKGIEAVDRVLLHTEESNPI